MPSGRLSLRDGAARRKWLDLHVVPRQRCSDWPAKPRCRSSVGANAGKLADDGIGDNCRKRRVADRCPFHDAIHAANGDAANIRGGGIVF